MTFVAGDRVRVAARAHRGHHRTPGYLKGKQGSITRRHGTFPDPETRAYGGRGTPERDLYLVEFAASDVWGDPADGVILADLFEHWLERA